MLTCAPLTYLVPIFSGGAWGSAWARQPHGTLDPIMPGRTHGTSLTLQAGRGRAESRAGRHPWETQLVPALSHTSCLTPHTLSHLPGSPSRQWDRGDPVHPPGPAVQCLQQPLWGLVLRGNPGEKRQVGWREEGPGSLPPLQRNIYQLEF